MFEQTIVLLGSATDFAVVCQACESGGLGFGEERSSLVRGQLGVHVAARSDRSDQMTLGALRPREVVVATQRAVDDRGGGLFHGTPRARLADDAEFSLGAKQDDRLLVRHPSHS